MRACEAGLAMMRKSLGGSIGSLAMNTRPSGHGSWLLIAISASSTAAGFQRIVPAPTAYHPVHAVAVAPRDGTQPLYGTPRVVAAASRWRVLMATGRPAF